MIEISPFIALIIFIVILVLFFWGIYMAIKTQKKRYIFAMMPFVLLLVGMFII